MGSIPKTDVDQAPKGRVEADQAATLASAWKAEGTVQLWAGAERRAAVERAERLRVVTGRGNRSR